VGSDVVTRARPSLPAATALAAGALATLVVVAVAAPDAVVLGATRLLALATITTGAALVVARTGAADLALAGAVAAGAYLGGVGAALLEVPVAAGLPVGAAAGAVVGAASGALHGRVGRLLGTLTSLSVGAATVAVLGAWPAAGGVAGFHAVGLPTPWGDRADLVAVGLLLSAASVLQVRVGRSRASAAASVAIRAPGVSAALGRHPVRDAAVTGAVGGALLGAGGVSLAAVDGSVLPGAYGLELTAALALAALLGGSALGGPALGSLVVWGPGTIWPLAPLVGTAPPLLLLGPIGLVVLALRRGRPLLRTPGGGRRPDPAARPAPRPPRERLALTARGLPTPAGPLDLRLDPGEVVALVGPNGAGKSTALARIGGQLADDGTVTIGGHPAPRGTAARARRGLARTWQRPPDVDAADVAQLLTRRDAAAAAARWAAEVLEPEASGPAAPLLWLAARGPAIALLDEPTDVPADRLANYLRGLASVGTAVLVVDHRPEVVAIADRVVHLGGQVSP
jgi:ABC-type branched-subunit amino acid transport system permease subunit